MSFDILAAEVEAGLLGKNSGIPTGLNRLSRYIGIRRRILTMVFGATGSGKSAYLHSAYILSPFDYISKHKPDIKFKVILFSMERSKIYVLAKWMSRKIFIDQGILIPIQKLLGWWDVKLTKDEHDLFLMYKDYLNELLEIVDIVDGAQNATGIYKYVKNYAEANGRFEQIDEYKKVYIPNHPNEIVIIAEDHLGLTRLEKGQNSKKEAIDKVSEYNQWMRDMLGYSPVTVSQLTRNLSNPIYQKMDSFEPNIDDIKESGRPGEDSDVVVSLFDPSRYKTSDAGGYKADSFIDKTTGGNYFRSLKLLKNSYGEDSIRIGLAFHGATGIFNELPRVKDMLNFDYEDLFNGTYFLRE